jgi:hypothetical protein
MHVVLLGVLETKFSPNEEHPIQHEEGLSRVTE